MSLPTDDKSIPDSDRLFRRVANNPTMLIPDNGGWRPSSAVFKTEELSVNIESLMKAQSRKPESTLDNYSGQYLVSIIAKDVREHKHPIVKDNVPKAGQPAPDPAHGLILGPKKSAFANAMVRSCKWVVAPPKE